MGDITMDKPVSKPGRNSFPILVGAVLGAAAIVVLAAALSGFVFNDDPDPCKCYHIGITIKSTSDNGILITNAGGPEVPDLESVTVSYQPYGAAKAIYVTNQSALDQLRLVGGSIVIEANGGTEGDTSDDPVLPTHVIVTGTFKDGDVVIIGASDVQSFY